jgi:hypothetical protein
MATRNTKEMKLLRDGIAHLSDEELSELTKLAFFWGMHPVGMYELRFVFTQKRMCRPRCPRCPATGF